MKTRTNEDIVAKARELWPDVGKWDSKDTCFVVERNDAERVELRVQQMYEAPGVSLPQLLELSRFFDTMNVETGSEFHHGGCETCDFGSEAGFVLYIRPGDPYKPLEVEP